MKIERFEDIIAWKKTKELNIINNNEFNEAFNLSEEISKILSGLIKTL